MDEENIKKLKRKMLLLFPAGFVIIEAVFYITSGSLAFWQAWIYSLIIFAWAFYISTYFLKRSPEFLERRMKYKEKELKQKTIIKIGSVIFLISFLIPGLDFRYGWSNMPVWLVLASDAMVIFGYYLVFLAFKENPFAARTVEVFEGQKVIDTGLYSAVRHPMYTGIILMYVFTPTALGSFWALPLVIPIIAIIIFRTLNEEEVLKRDLPGYAAYCEKVRWRLLPHVW